MTPDQETAPEVEPFFWVDPGPGVGVLHPLPASASGWSADQIRGMAVSGALARATEQAAQRAMPTMQPVRWGVDLFRPARVRPTTVVTTVVRSGRRIGLIDAELHQDGRAVARSRALFAQPRPAAPVGRAWQPSHEPILLPPAGLRPAPGDSRLYFSEREGWTARSDRHQNDSRKQLWHLPVVLVENETPTPLQMVASIADVTSLVVNWGTAGMEFINADFDLILNRLPMSMEVGLSVVDRSEQNGISTGTAVLFDRGGVLGRASTVAVANPEHHVDPGNRRPDLSAYAGDNRSAATGGPVMEQRS